MAREASAVKFAKNKLSGQVSAIWAKLGDHLTSMQGKHLRFSNIGTRTAGCRRPLLIGLTFLAHGCREGLNPPAKAAAQKRRQRTVALVPEQLGLYS